MKMPPIREVIYLGDTVIEIISADNPKLKYEVPWEVGYRGIALEVEDMAKAVDYLEGIARRLNKRVAKTILKKAIIAHCL